MACPAEVGASEIRSKNMNVRRKLLGREAER